MYHTRTNLNSAVVLLRKQQIYQNTSVLAIMFLLWQVAKSKDNTHLKDVQ